MQSGHSWSFWLNVRILHFISFTVFDLNATSIDASSKLNFELFRYSWQVYFSYWMSFTLEWFDCFVLRSSKAFLYIFSLMYFLVRFLFPCFSSSSSISNVSRSHFASSHQSPLFGPSLCADTLF